MFTRWPHVLLMAALGGCLPPSTTSGAGAAGSSGNATSGAGDSDGGVACSAMTTCADCKFCALNGPCATLWGTCMTNSDCSAIDQCLPLCSGDPTCQSDCYTNNPNGASDYKAANKCVFCAQCSKECPGQCM